jgi:hypothetical protein
MKELAQRILESIKGFPDDYELAVAESFKEEEHFDLDAVCTVAELKQLAEFIIAPTAPPPVKKEPVQFEEKPRRTRR